MKELINRIKYGLPRTIENEWFAKVVHMEEEKLPPAFDDEGTFIDYEVGHIVPIKDLKNGKMAFYKITNITRQRGNWLYDTDAFKYDLEYHHVGLIESNQAIEK